MKKISILAKNTWGFLIKLGVMGAFNYFKTLGNSWWILRIFLDRIGIKVSHKLIDFHFSRIFLFVALASNYFSNVTLLEFLDSFLVFFFFGNI